MVKATNPGSVANYSFGSEDKCFESMMIAFAAPIQGWKDGGRPFVGFDAFHLTGKHGGCLMTATGLDGQNGIVIKVVRNECGENLHLFMKEMKPLIEDHPAGKITFISDRQKGLQVSLDAANMDDLIKLSPAAAAYMMKEKPEQWSRAFFDPSACCEHLNNNFSESFKNLDKPMRDKPICTLGMMYGQLVMGTMYKRRNVSANWEDGKLVPTAQDLIDEMQKCFGAFRVNGAIVDKLYEVTSKTNAIFQVDVVEKTCSCFQWKLRGFVCQHAVCVLIYCSKYYHMESYKAIYAPEMRLLIGREDWPEPLVEINPPIDMMKPGRPCKKRKRAHDEPHSEKVVKTWKRCKMPGHNRRTCAGAPVGSNPKKRRQRTMVEGGSHKTTYPDPAELNTIKRASKRGRSKGSASSSQPTTVSSSQPSTGSSSHPTTASSSQSHCMLWI
ncbi:uncharacterized protein LOC113326330 [Papaver somniferum]|uniref:uncharacterized protein LOC113326330 n=1 Tax=Papaver somniferum TaxID=3469 RepID=UPI000E6F93E8|nr:uncharacterized protein LOC113326330 [Papaver somniferum]